MMFYKGDSIIMRTITVVACIMQILSRNKHAKFLPIHVNVLYRCMGVCYGELWHSLQDWCSWNTFKQ